MCEGDVITWNATRIIDTPSITSTSNYEIIATVYNFPQPLEYCNGSLNDNGTIYDPYSHSNKGIQPEWLFDIFDRPSVDINFIAIQVELNSLKIGIQNLGDNPEYSFTENNATSWKLEGAGVQGETTWTYFGEVNYTADMVLYSVVENVVQTSSEATASESYTWIRTNYVHGPGCVDEDPDDPPDNGTGEENVIPGFPLYSMVVAICIGFIIIRKRKS